MFRLDRVSWCGSVPLLVLIAGVAIAGQTPEAPAPGPAADARSADELAAPHDKADFAGTWDYNTDDSIDIRTGRPEQRPRSATQRGGTAAAGRGATGGGGRTAGGSTGGGGDAGGGGGGGRGGNIPMVGPTPDMVREARDMARDLLEVAERLTIKVDPTTVSMTDDLERVRTYVTDNRKERHQIAASRFDVRSEWRNSQLIQQVEGAYDFKMSQTYFLSPDGKRLFVMVRVGDPRRTTPQTGFNRVYDRVE